VNLSIYGGNVLIYQAPTMFQIPENAMIINISTIDT
jgi:hypothetical protein